MSGDTTVADAVREYYLHDNAVPLLCATVTKERHEMKKRLDELEAAEKEREHLARNAPSEAALRGAIRLILQWQREQQQGKVAA